MERRKFLIGAGSAAVGSSALIGSGAVSSITADRDVDLRVAGDSNAYLALEAGDNDYVNENGDGLITFNFDGDNDAVSGDGVNNRADTTLEDAFSIANQSDRELFVWASFADENGNAIDPTSGGARSVELLVDGTDITYPGGQDKSNEETSRTLGQTEDAGAVNFEVGQEENVEIRFLVYGSGEARDTPFRVVFHAEDRDNAPQSQSAWEVDVNDRP